VYGYLGHGVSHPPKACLLELIITEWPEPHGASDHFGFYDASQDDGGHLVLIGSDFFAEQSDNEADADAVDCGHVSNKGHEAVAMETPEVMSE
jgi:hypothetical protein